MIANIIILYEKPIAAQDEHFAMLSKTDKDFLLQDINGADVQIHIKAFLSQPLLCHLFLPSLPSAPFIFPCFNPLCAASGIWESKVFSAVFQVTEII